MGYWTQKTNFKPLVGIWFVRKRHWNESSKREAWHTCVTKGTSFSILVHLTNTYHMCTSTLFFIAHLHHISFCGMHILRFLMFNFITNTAVNPYTVWSPPSLPTVDLHVNIRRAVTKCYFFVYLLSFVSWVAVSSSSVTVLVSCIVAQLLGLLKMYICIYQPHRTEWC